VDADDTRQGEGLDGLDGLDDAEEELLTTSEVMKLMGVLVNRYCLGTAVAWLRADMQMDGGAEQGRAVGPGNVGAASGCQVDLGAHNCALGERITSAPTVGRNQLRVLGPDHPDTLTARNNVAGWAGQSGDVGEALRLFRELLPDQLRVLGPDHPETLRTRNRMDNLRERSEE
jgi:hypothetical protein